MANIPEVLLNTLENLGHEDLKTFQWHLIRGVEGFTPIQKAVLEKADRHDTVDRLVQRYGHSRATEITLAILKKINQNQVYQELRTKLKDDGEKSEEVTDQSTTVSSTAAQTGETVNALTTDDHQHCIQLMSTLRQIYECILIGNSQTGHTKFLEDIYTELIIVQNESGGVIQKHEVMQMEMSYNRPAGKEICVVCSDLFKVQPGNRRRNRKVLTMGIAGVGKTVSVNKFILDWAKGEENQDINFVFPITFRELNLKKDKKFSLIELLNHCFFSSKPGLKSLPEADGAVLFIFDGLDECRFPLCFEDGEEVKDINEKTSVGSLITNLINRNLVPFALIWITCRPAAAHLIPREYINLVTEVRGFNDEQKEAYFSKYCSEDLAVKIVSHIKKSRSLHIMCQIPVFCWISATVLQPLMIQDSNKDIPTNLTGMYASFLLQQKNLMKKKYCEKTQTFDAEHIILKLGELAFCNLESGTLIFYEEDLRKCGIDVSDGTVFSGVCTQIFSQQEGVSERNIFSFVHLSVQENLAALYVHHLHCNKKRNAFKKETFLNKLQWKNKGITDLHKCAVKRALQSKNGHLDLFVRFLIGLSLEDSVRVLTKLLPNLNMKPECVRDTADYIKKKLHEKMSSDRSMNLFHCLNELKDNSLTTEIQKYLNSGDLSTQDHSSTQWSALVFVLLMSGDTQEKFELKKYGPSDEGLSRLLLVVKNTRQALLGYSNLSKNSCEALATVFSSDSALKQLDLSNNDLKDSGVELLSVGLKSSYCKLETLRLASCNISIDSCKALASVLSSDSTLKHLDLSNNYLMHMGVRLLSVGLKSSYCKLETLRLASCLIRKDACDTLLSVLLREGCSLKELDLSQNFLYDSEVELLLAGLKNSHCKLQILKLALCNLGKKTCEVLESILKLETSCLKELDMSNNVLQDSGVEMLSAGLKSPHCKLEILRLSGCMVTEKGCSSLASALSSNPSHLKELDLSYNHPGESGMKLLTARLEDSSCSLNTLRVEHEGEMRIKSGLWKYSCKVTLDPNTAHTCLSLSDGNRRVTNMGLTQSYPDHPERFNECLQVLSTESLTGRCYWEAEWSGTVAEIAVTYKSVRRKGNSSDGWFGQNEKSWILFCSNSRYCVCHNNKRTDIPDGIAIHRRIGVYLDCPAGTLSFYIVSKSYKLTYLYTFSTTFTEPLCAGFGVSNTNSSVCVCVRFNNHMCSVCVCVRERFNTCVCVCDI